MQSIGFHLSAITTGFNFLSTPCLESTKETYASLKITKEVLYFKLALFQLFVDLLV